MEKFKHFYPEGFQVVSPVAAVWDARGKRWRFMQVWPLSQTLKPCTKSVHNEILPNGKLHCPFIFLFHLPPQWWLFAQPTCNKAVFVSEAPFTGSLFRSFDREPREKPIHSNFSLMTCSIQYRWRVGGGSLVWLLPLWKKKRQYFHKTSDKPWLLNNRL